MNKAKKNNSGFTLIELVVVIALLTLMMGAILQLMDPIRNVYHDTLDTVNTKTAGETMISYVEDKTRYATNVLVLENYKGVPQITPSGNNAAKVGLCDVGFTDVMIIDNTNLRGSALSDYPGDTATVAGRKHCKGAIYNISDIGAANVLDLTKASTGTVGENIYGNYTYDIGLDVKSTDGYAMLNFDIESYEMEYNGSDYVKATDPEYKASRYFDLVNINIDNADSYIINDVVDFDTAPDYTKYPNQLTYPSGLTTQQQKYFSDVDPNNKYTYIFYKVSKTNEALRYSVTFQYSDTDPSFAGQVYGSPLKVEAGKCLTNSQVPSLGSRVGFTSYYFSDGTGAVDPTTYPINQDTIFTICYVADSGFVWHDAIFYDVDGSEIITVQVADGISAVDQAPAPTYDPNTQYYKWYDGSGNEISTVNCVSTTTPPSSNTYEFYPDVIDKYKVEFEINGSVDGALTQYVTGGKTGESGGAVIPATIPASTDPDKIFDNWYIGSTPINNYTVSGNVKFVAKFKDKPASNVTATISAPQYAWWGVCYYNVTIVNGTSSIKGDWEAKITLPSGASVNSSEWYISASQSGNTVTLKSSADPGKIPAGGSITFPVRINASQVQNDLSALPTGFYNVTITTS